MYKRCAVLLASLSVISCAGKLENQYVAFRPYAEPSPVRAATEDGLPKEPLHPGGGGKVALPSTRPDQDSECVITLSISGGGSNSAAFAWGALEELNSRQAGPGGRSILQEVDYFVTASGGGIAALMFMEVLREHRLREGAPLTQQGAALYLGSARFRGVLDAQLRTVNQVVLSGFASWLGNSSSKLEHALQSSIVGEGADCQGVEAGPLAQVPTGTDEEFKRYVLCPLTRRLRFEDVFVDGGQAATLPAFIPTMTLFESGENLPATRAWFEQIGIREVMFALPDSWFGDVVKVEDLDYVHAVTLSMGFPGIGPVLALADGRSGKRYGVTIADGGQTDNLGLWIAYNATRNELLSQERRGAVHIILDSALEPETPFVETKVGNWRATTPERVIGNGLPLLRAVRLINERNLKLRARDELKEKASAYTPFFVRAEDVLAQQEMKHEPFVDIAGNRACQRAGLPTDSESCFAQAKPCVNRCKPRERLGGIMSSLANDRQRAEDLVRLGREAMAKVYDGRLKHALTRCLAPAADSTLK
jgi:hypothetical protein